MKRSLSFCIALMMAIFCLNGCSTQPQAEMSQSASTDNSKLKVVTTIFPQYDFTRQIAGDSAEVTMLLKPGAESHSYEPTPQDIQAVQECDLFIYTGGENDIWVENILESMDDKKPDTLKLVDCVATVTEEIVEGMEHGHGHEHAEIEESSIKDRPLSDFTGDYQTVLPYYEDGTLDDYITDQAEENESSFDDMKQELLERYTSDYQNISISENTVTFTDTAGKVSAEYDYSGFKTITGEDGDITSVWYAFEITSRTDGIPSCLLFSDHAIDRGEHGEEHDEHDEVPHFHLLYGDESSDSLIDIENWTPVYFAADASGEQVKETLEGHSHESEEEMDEHVWTSPINAIEIVKKITEILSQKDNTNAPIYSKNSTAYIKQLENLDASLHDVTDNAKRKTILFGDRFPFRYLADEYGLSYYAAFSGCSTETDASAATVAFLIDKVEEDAIPVVFSIELSNVKIADTICETTDAQKLTLHSCHNVSQEQMTSGATYLSIMEENIENLRAALY